MYKPKKSLGQNFLKSQPALREIVKAGEIEEGETVLEIGPGKGILTEKLLEAGAKVLAVEKDRELFEFLQTKFEEEISSGQLQLVCDDILKFELESYKPKAESPARPDEPGRSGGYKLIANIPYNITGAILKKFLTAKLQPERMVLLVQREVAQRIIGLGGESLLSISVKAYGEPKMIMKVPARYFSPAPKVDSAVIAIKNISRRVFEESGAVDEDLFWQIVKAGFAHKRKKLSSNLKNLLYPIGKTYGVELGNKRAEELTLLDWVNLAKSANINKKE